MLANQVINERLVMSPSTMSQSVYLVPSVWTTDYSFSNNLSSMRSTSDYGELRQGSRSADNGTMADTTVAMNPGLPNEHQYILIALYTATTALAVTGNLVVIAALSVGRRSRTDLRAFLINLAVADLIIAAFCMPFTFTTTMLHDWVFGSVMCTVVLFVQVSDQQPSAFTNSPALCIH